MTEKFFLLDFEYVRVSNVHCKLSTVTLTISLRDDKNCLNRMKKDMSCCYNGKVSMT